MKNQHLQEWFDNPITGPAPKPLSPRLPPKPEPEFNKSWIPHLHDRIRLVHDSGMVREVELISVLRGVVTVQFSKLAGRLEIALKKNAGRGRACVWRIWEPEIARIRDHQKELLKEFNGVSDK